MSLADQICVPCRGGVPPLTAAQIAPLHAQLDGWDVKDDKRLSRDYRFKNFAEAMAYANRVAAIAEEQQHHPDLYVRWGGVRVEVWTHKIDGLTESDFYFAAKCDRAYAEDRAAATSA
jgi:4a-hydroxytetrahydrobiopterin dehydratase